MLGSSFKRSSFTERGTLATMILFTIASATAARQRDNSARFRTLPSVISLSNRLEKQIRKNPSDWFWVHNRWKTPNPQFLLRHYHRGVYVPAKAERLKPFRVLIRSSNLPAEAAMSVEAARRIKRGRPDLCLSILVIDKLADFWRNVPEVDEVLQIEDGSSVFAVARKIRGRFDAAILFPSSSRSCIEVWLVGIPRRVGFSKPWRDLFVNQFVRNRPGSLPSQKNEPLQIAERIGADLTEELPLLADPKQKNHHE